MISPIALPRTVQRFRRADLPSQPWKNGGGVTREVVSLPAALRPPGVATGALTDFGWRVSIAHIAASGPFSAFEGVDRIITLLEGPGVHLRSADGAIDHRLDRPLQPFAFAGEAPVQAELLGADCHDFNVMTQRSVCRARVQVLRKATVLPLVAQGLLMAVRGAWCLQGDRQGDMRGHVAAELLAEMPTDMRAPSAQRLDAGEGLWWSVQDRPWQLQPQGHDAALLAVLIEPATP